MRRRALAIALLAVLAAVLASCGGSSTKSSTTTLSNASTLRPLHLQSQLLTFKLLPAPASSSSDPPGAQLVFTAMLFHDRDTSASGRSQGSCARTGPGTGEVFQCSVAFLLKDGTIYGQGVASTQGLASGVVAGGTGRYTGVRGTFVYRRIGGGARVALRFNLQS